MSNDLTMGENKNYSLGIEENKLAVYINADGREFYLL
jgi:hypothetical protein